MPKRPTGSVPLQLRFGDAVGVAKKIQNSGGGALTKAMLAEAMSYSLSSSGFRMKLSAMKQHGLIEEEGEKIKLSKLGLSVVVPVPDDNGKSLKEAFLRVPIYLSIHERYANKMLPLTSELANLLVHERKLSGDLAKVWAENFVEGAKSAFLTRPRGERLLLLGNPHIEGTNEESGEPAEPPAIDSSEPLKPPKVPETSKPIFSFPFPGGKVVQITSSGELTQAELGALIGMLTAYKTSLPTLGTEGKGGE